MRFAVAAALIVLTMLAPTTPSQAAATECHWVEVERFVFGSLVVTRERRCTTTSSSPSPVGDEPVIDPYGDVACVALAIALEIPIADFCQPEAEHGPALTEQLIARAFRRVPLPPARLQIQPPNGRTLVNFATNFYTERSEFTRTVRLLGQRVQLRITPSQFTWHFDDGETATTTSPGAPYPRLEVTHDYLRKGGVSPRVDTTYTAMFRVGGGAWRPVPGSVTIPGTAVDLDVVEASPVLVGYN